MRKENKLIRLDNLERIIDQCGSAAELSRVTGISPSYISQLRNQYSTPSGQSIRGIGDDTCEKIEECLKLEKGWMDIDRRTDVASEALDDAYRKVEAEKIKKEIYDNLSELSEKELTIMTDLLNALLSKHDKKKIS